MIGFRRCVPAIALVVIFAAACGGSGDSAGDPVGADASSIPSGSGGDAGLPDVGDGVDDCGEGGAFPDDPDFREMLCEVQSAQLDVLATGGTMDPSWVSRTSEAVLLYADDRDQAISDLQELLGEMQGAVGSG